MSFRVALVLGDFDKGFEAPSLFCVVSGKCFAPKRSSREHLSFDIFELCGIARNLAPIPAAVSSIHFHKSSGNGLSVEEKGEKVPASSKLASVITTRCRLAPPGTELHSHPIRAVNSPGSSKRLALSSIRCQALRAEISAPGGAAAAVFSVHDLAASIGSSSAGNKLAK